MRTAFSEELRRRIQAGEPEALLRGLASLSALWFAQSGSLIEMRCQLGASHAVAQPLLAAAMDLHDVLCLSPQGRKAVADLGGKPVPQQPESE